MGMKVFAAGYTIRSTKKGGAEGVFTTLLRLF